MSDSLGYSDTPFLPDCEYRVHDGTRPQPPVVDPGEPGTARSDGRAPSDAIVLFGGADLTHWRGRSGPAEWRVDHGYMEVAPGTGDISTVQSFGDIQLHVEWASPKSVKGSGQGRGNSGIFLADDYEIQVLDCFGNPTYADGTTGGVYGQYPPLANACREPGEWQTFDIIWTAPRFEGDSVVSPAYVTVLLNGILLHNHQALLGPTGHRNRPPYVPHGDRPLRLQDHGDPVRFRNIWVRPIKS